MPFIEHDIFQHGTEAQGLENVRLVLGREVDRLGVAAAFDIKDAIVTPAVLVIADEMPLRVGRERCLARAAKAVMVFLSAFTTKTAVYVLLRGFPGVELLVYVGAS